MGIDDDILRALESDSSDAGVITNAPPCEALSVETILRAKEMLDKAAPPPVWTHIKWWTGTEWLITGPYDERFQAYIEKCKDMDIVPDFYLMALDKVLSHQRGWPLPHPSEF